VSAARADGRAFTQLTKEGARRTLDRIKRQLRTLDADVARLYHGGAAELLGYGTGAAGWEALCADLFADVTMLRPTPAARLERVLEMRREEMSTRGIGAALGVSAATVVSDLRRLEKRGEQLPADVISLDSRRRSATGERTAAVEEEPVQLRPLPAELQLTDLMLAALTHVHAQGGHGLTCSELELETGWGHGRASSLLYRLERAGLIGRPGIFRGPHSAYVVTFQD
jgi:hypothetical protein